MSRGTDADRAPAGRIASPPDEVDQRILAGLRTDGRISMSALADQVGVSRATVYTRVENMLTAGVITGFSAQVDSRQVPAVESVLVMDEVIRRPYLLPSDVPPLAPPVQQQVGMTRFIRATGDHIGGD